MEEEDTHEVSVATADTDRLLAALAHDDTDEWDDTDQEMMAQGTIDEYTPQMFDDTGVMIVDRPPPKSPAKTNPEMSAQFAVTFREQANPGARPYTRATTEETWPPEPREPAMKVPLMRERAYKRAGVYSVVTDSQMHIQRIDVPKNKN